MPELPEVETTVQGLHELINNKIIKIKVYVKKLRYDLPLNLETLLKNCNILKIFRIGKYIIFNLSNDYSVIFHLGMSGRIRLLPKKNFLKENHDHLVFFIKNKGI